MPMSASVNTAGVRDQTVYRYLRVFVLGLFINIHVTLLVFFFIIYLRDLNSIGLPGVLLKVKGSLL